MMYPILCKVQYETLHDIFRTRQVWIQLGFSLVVNWIVAPLIMVPNLLNPFTQSNSGGKRYTNSGGLPTFSWVSPGLFSPTRRNCVRG